MTEQPKSRKRHDTTAAGENTKVNILEIYEDTTA